MSVEGVRALPSFEQGHQYVQDARRRRGENNTFLGANYIRNPVKVMYSAGRWDVEPVTMPSVQALAIVDLVPLLFSYERPENKYSAVIHAQLEANNGQYLSLPEIFQNPLFSSHRQQTFMGIVEQSYRELMGFVVSGRGYEISNTREIEDVRTDSFPEVLAGLVFWGADPSSIQVGKFGNDFRVQCDLDGKRKTIIFHQEKVGAQFGRRGTEQRRWAQTVFDGFDEGTTAMLVKGDVHFSSVHLIDAIRPDVVYGPGMEIGGIQKTLRRDYEITPKNSLQFPHPNEALGYGAISSLRVAYRHSA